MQLAEATWTEVDDADAEVALLPVGSTEQHGPHAPLGTDTLAAEAVAAEAADRLPADEILVAPPIPVGVSEEHRHFAGTMWVSEDAFRAYVREAAASLAEHGLEEIVYVNGHGGNVHALREVAGRLTRDGVARAVPFTWFEAVEAEEMGHAGPLETGLVRHVAPELVREDRVDEAVAGASQGWGEWVSGVNLAFDSAEFTASGVVGDPREGDAERGATLLDGAAEGLIALLEAMAERDE